MCKKGRKRKFVAARKVFSSTSDDDSDNTCPTNVREERVVLKRRAHIKPAAKKKRVALQLQRSHDYSTLAQRSYEVPVSSLFASLELNVNCENAESTITRETEK